MPKVHVHVELIELGDGTCNYYVFTTTSGPGVFGSSLDRGHAVTREAACDEVAARLPGLPALWRKELVESSTGCWSGDWVL